VSEGSGIVRASWLGTALLTLTAGLAVVAPRPFSSTSTVVSVGLFAAGCVVFIVAFLRAVGRSRTEAISVTGLFLLTGGATPPSVRRHLLTSLGVQLGVGLATAAARPFTTQAAGVLAPMWGLGLCGLWAARHGRFDPR